QFLLMTPGVQEADYSSLVALLYGASPIAEEVLKGSLRTFGCQFVQAYGLTETTGAIVLLPHDDHDPEGPNAHRLRAAGIAGPGVELRVVDADGNDVPVGEIGVPDDRWGEAVKACVVTAADAEVSEQEIIEFARGRLAHFKCPRSVDFVAELPRNPSGKILKKDLRAPYWQGRARNVN